MKDLKVSYQAIPGMEVTPESLIIQASNKYNVPVEDMMRKTRKGRIVEARQYAMYLIRKQLNLSQKAIGELFNNKDHATVLHACRVIETRIETNQLLIN